jgi:hypothetical protein
MTLDDVVTFLRPFINPPWPPFLKGGNLFPGAPPFEKGRLGGIFE